MYGIDSRLATEALAGLRLCEGDTSALCRASCLCSALPDGESLGDLSVRMSILRAYRSHYRHFRSLLHCCERITYTFHQRGGLPLVRAAMTKSSENKLFLTHTLICLGEGTDWSIAEESPG